MTTDDDNADGCISDNYYGHERGGTLDSVGVKTPTELVEFYFPYAGIFFRAAKYMKNVVCVFVRRGDVVMRCKKVLAGALAIAACFFGGAAYAAAPEEQIDVILNLPVTHGDELEMRLSENGDFAVTDLDGNGRIELLFLQEMRNGVPEDVDIENENVRSAWRHIASVPVFRKLCGYEISANGNKLEPLAVIFTDDEIDPNLRYLESAVRDTQRGIIYYNVSTLTRVGDAGYRVSLQSVSLQNGALQIQTIASEFGNYGIYHEQGTPEAVFGHAMTRHGTELSQSACAEFFSKFSAGYGAGADEHFNAAIRWCPVQALREAKLQPSGMKPLMLESWQGFSLERLK